MAGRRPKPTHLKLLNGNPGKRAINPNEPKPPAELPPPPDYLNDIAKAEWHRIGEVLLRLGLMTTLDRAALAAYCTTYARWVDAEESIKKTGPVVRAPSSGYPMISPYLVVANRALEQMRAFMIEFGLTPAARSRISVNAHGNEDPFENWIQNKV